MQLFDWENIQLMLQQITENPIPSLLIIINLIIIESLLSVDNAAVLATMVLDLPKEQRKKALHYGIIGAYLFRGICLIFAAILIEFWWLKPLGGLYLLYMVYSWWKGRKTKKESDDYIDKKENWFYKLTVNKIGKFWATVIAVEIMDLAFSIDNVFAAVAMSKNIILVWIGVFIGILSMRFVAQGFVKLMEKYPYLEVSAFTVLLVLGLKLMLAIPEHFFPKSNFTVLMTNHYTDWVFSIITLIIFAFPILLNFFTRKNKT